MIIGESVFFVALTMTLLSIPVGMRSLADAAARSIASTVRRMLYPDLFEQNTIGAKLRNGIIARTASAAFFSSVIPSFSARSHLLSISTHARCASSILPAMRLSCIVGPITGSSRRITTSASSIACSDRNSEKLSTDVFDIFVCGFIPAVSTSM